jgi:hypothetical protein
MAKFALFCISSAFCWYGSCTFGWLIFVRGSFELKNCSHIFVKKMSKIISNIFFLRLFEILRFTMAKERVSPVFSKIFPELLHSLSIFWISLTSLKVSEPGFNLHRFQIFLIWDIGTKTKSCIQRMQETQFENGSLHSKQDKSVTFLHSKSLTSFLHMYALFTHRNLNHQADKSIKKLRK